MLLPGDPAPWFKIRSTVNPAFNFDTIGGRYVFLSFLGSASLPGSARIVADVEAAQARFDTINACFLGVSTDPDDEKLGRMQQRFPGVVYFWDFDRAVSRLYGAAPAEGDEYKPHTVVLTPSMRVIALAAHDSPDTLVPNLLNLLDALPPIEKIGGFAPVLLVPMIFEPQFCRTLIEQYEQHGGRDSGFMRDVNGKTVELMDYSHKRRMDYSLTDENLIKGAQARLHRRLVPEIKKAFQFNATRIERNIVCCYDGSSGGHFRAHRDNTTLGTAHRRFAVTINLNAEEFEGGELRFPEFGPRTYKAPTGGAIVFSCSLLHEAMPVTKGKRYAFLPFLYDEEAAKIRQANLQFLGGQMPTQTPG